MFKAFGAIMAYLKYARMGRKRNQEENTLKGETFMSPTV